MRSHQIDFQIHGEDIQIVEIELDPQETVIAEAGAMLFMEDGIQFETKLGDGTAPEQGFLGKVFQAGSRLLTGESLFMTHFTNRGYGKRKVAFAAPYPGTIKPVDLAQIYQNTLIVQKDAFLCAALGTSINIHFNKRLGAGFFGGEGFILQRIQGDGMAFIHSGGVVIERQLSNETLRVDTGCIVAFEPQIHFDIQAAGNLKSMIFWRRRHVFSHFKRNRKSMVTIFTHLKINPTSFLIRSQYQERGRLRIRWLRVII